MSSAGSDRYRLIESLYQQAVDLPRDRRHQFLNDRCQSDPHLLGEVETLLRHYEAASGGFLAEPPFETDGWKVPERIGRYRVLGKLGEGGMGTVFEARQESPDRKVALKVIRATARSSEALRRFELEAAILGRLAHPNIAQIYEAGVADFGVGPSRAREPFMAMELIPGRPLAIHVAQTQPDIPQRLELFTQICDGVHHAHQKGVIHRDLKPGNILVTADGRPKILDFGVARAIQGDETISSLHTQPSQMVGTIPYMSPEQVNGKLEELDTRSDVYSLGVILYELLAQRLPYDLAGKSVAAAARIICESNPLPLGAVHRAFRGDLETIVQKALEKQREQRYASAAELAEDVRRHLRNEPISARPPSLAYQASKFAVRHRGVAIAASLALLAIISGGAAAGWQAVRATQAAAEASRQTELAERSSRVAQAVNDFLNEDLLGQANPFNEPDRSLRLRDVVDRAAARVEQRFVDEPLVEAAIRQTLGVTYRSLGELDAAEPHLSRALTLLRGALGEDDRKTIRAAIELGELLRRATRYDEADPLLTDAAEGAERLFGPRDRDTLEARSDLAALALSRNQPELAESIGRDVLAIRRETVGNDHGATLVSMNILGSALERLGRYDEAEALYRECVERSRRVLGEEHPDTMVAISNLGLFYSRLDRFAEAEPLCLEALELRRRVLGPEHPVTLEAMNNVGYFYSVQSRFAECEPYYTQTYEIRRQKLGAEHPDTQLSRSNLAWLYTQLQRWDEAERMLVELVDTDRRLNPDSLDCGLSLQMLGGFYVKRNRPAEGEALLSEALELLKRNLPEGSWQIGACSSSFGSCLRRLGRFEEAEAALLEGHRLQQAALGPNHQQTRLAVRGLVDLYQDWGRPEESERWRAASQPAP